MSKSPEKTSIGVYFDCICGIISSVISLTAIILTTIFEGIFDPIWYSASLTFWILYLCLSIVLIIIGLYTRKKEKEYLANRVLTE